MKISLMKKLSLGFLAAVLGSIILASLISNYAVGNEFKKYLINEHTAKVDNAVKLVNEVFSSEQKSSGLNTNGIQNFAELQKLYIEVRDSNNNTIYTSGNSYLQQNGMMGNRMSGMMGGFSEINPGDYTEGKYPLTVNNKNTGTIIIGYFGTSYFSSSAMTFMSTLNHSFIISAFAALIFGFIISMIISRQLSMPLVKITETANKMRSGDMNAKADIKTSTKEIDELSNSINYLAEALNSQEMLRKRLTSDVAHELRTPLTTLKTHMEAFVDGVWEPTPERFETLNEEIDRLIKMVDNLRNLAKLEEAGFSLNRSSFNLSEELSRIIETFKPLFIKAGYDLSGSISPGITAVMDKEKFRQIMNNLISNSYKYLKTDGKVQVMLQMNKNNIMIKVIDTGIGIPEKDLPFIFERFYRTDLSRSKNTGGSGIGLTIAKAFVEAHGGKIYAESKVNEGTTFTVELPGGEKRDK